MSYATRLRGLILPSAALAALFCLAGCLGSPGPRPAAAPEPAPAPESAPVAETAPSAPLPEPVPLTPAEAQICADLGLDPVRVSALKGRPIYQFEPDDLNVWLPFQRAVEPSLPGRVVALGRKNIGQPYEIYLLGEFPFETYDPQPLYCLEKSDCVVFSEHTYAMALARDWPTFFATLQRIRYKDGRISLLTRNHWTTADWDVNNSWLVRDVTAEVGGDLCRPFYKRLNRANAKLFTRHGLKPEVPFEEIRTVYIPAEAVETILPRLQNGDFVNVIYEDGGINDCRHTGLIAIGADGTANFLHSTPPAVREQPLMEYAARQMERNREREAEGESLRWVGFRFLRLHDDPVANLIAIDGPDAPRLQLPAAARLAPAP